MTKFTRYALASTAAVALLSGASLSASAAPLAASDSIKNSVQSPASDVQWRRHRGRDVAIGVGAFGLGVAAGAAIANNRGYYDAPYGYYEQPYGYYEAPGYYYGQGNTSNGFGYGRDDTGGNH